MWATRAVINYLFCREQFLVHYNFLSPSFHPFVKVDSQRWSKMLQGFRIKFCFRLSIL
jgi:hypothetical protein